MAKRPTLTTEEKQTRDRTRRDELAQRLIDGVTAIQTSADFQRLLAWSAAFTAYSLNNVLLIWSQRPDSTRVAGFHTWRKLGRTVNKGAKGIMIYAPRIVKPKQDGDEPRVYFGVEHVFDVSDTSGDPVPSIAVQLEGAGNAAAYAALVRFGEAEGLTITQTPTVATDARGYYSAKERVIYVQPTNPAQMLQILAHELAHHLDRDHTASREEKETIAEGAAHLVCAAVGVDTSTASYPYIAGWSASEGGPALIKACLERIHAIARVVVAAMQPEQDGNAAADGRETTGIEGY
jgi:hypothetical protein